MAEPTLAGGWAIRASTRSTTWPLRQERTQEPAYPCHLTRLPTDGRRGADASLASARPRTMHEGLREPSCPRTGSITTIRCPKNRAPHT